MFPGFPPVGTLSRTTARTRQPYANG